MSVKIALLPPAVSQLLNQLYSSWLRRCDLASYACLDSSRQNHRFFQTSDFCKWLFRLLLLPLLLLLLSAEKLPQGFNYKHLTKPGPLSIHILEVDPAYAKIAPVGASPYLLALETTSSIAKRKGALAAVNGGFFHTEGKYAGSPSGILKIGGKLLSSPRLKRAAIGWSEGGKKALIDRIDLKAHLNIDDLSFQIDGINQPYAPDKAILYTDSFFSSTLSPSGTTEVVMDQKGCVASVKTAGNAVFSERGAIYTIGNQLQFKLPNKMSGSCARISFELCPQVEPSKESIWNRFDEIVGGTPFLIHKGEKIPDFTVEAVRTSFLQARHPRTAIGIKPDGHWLFVVVDGRQADFSIGMTMQELCDFLFSLGCEEAINLDGGGSSTFVLNGKVMNSPSSHEYEENNEVKENLVSNAILIWSQNE